MGDKIDFIEQKDYSGASPDDVNRFLLEVEKEDQMAGGKVKTLVFMDELHLRVEGGKQNCEGLVAPKDVEFFIAVSPWAYGKGQFDALMPINPEIMGTQLTCRHRNCREIYELSRHMATRTTNLTAHQMCLRESKDPIKDIPLPEGKEPLWIVQEKSCDTGTLLRSIENNYIEKGMNVTVLQVSHLTTDMQENMGQVV